uniref:Uncharacterized protein n=1 Tax=Photinus pyralis TaxID=7054 RepID=A0A1Y1MQD6_PHOPY
MQKLVCISECNSYLPRSIPLWKMVGYNVVIAATSSLIGITRNGYFWGILKLVSHDDPVSEHNLKQIKDSHNRHLKMKAHYLSSELEEAKSACSCSALQALSVFRQHDHDGLLPHDSRKCFICRIALMILVR